MAAAKQILNYEHELKHAGTPDKQSEVHARHLAEIIENTLVTKDHFDYKLKEFSNDIRNQLIELRKEALETRDSLKMSIQDSKIEMYKLFIGSTSVLLAGSGLLQIMFRFLK